MTQWLNSKNIDHQNNQVKIQINIETIIIKILKCFSYYYIVITIKYLINQNQIA